MTAASSRSGPWYAAFDGGPGTPLHARESAAAFLTAIADQAPPADATRFDKALLVVSELVTNAVRHAPGPVVLTLDAEDGGIGITVRDTSPVLPEPRSPDLLGGTGGFGWSAIIKPLAIDFDVRSHPGGKEIHALLPW